MENQENYQVKSYNQKGRQNTTNIIYNSPSYRVNGRDVSPGEMADMYLARAEAAERELRAKDEVISAKDELLADKGRTILNHENTIRTMGAVIGALTQSAPDSMVS